MITWKNVTVKLGDLKPWEHNPKSISKSHAKRLLESWDKFGQFQTIAIGPDFEVYDGHQRLSVLRAAQGDKFQVDARQSSQPLTDDERRQLVIEAHAGTTGQFDWDSLANWDAAQLQEWGLDGELIKDWKAGIGAVTEMIEAAKPEPPEDVEPQIDKSEELREKWGVESGQLWKLGEHRIICGDSTVLENIEKLMNGEKADLLFTSPPYGQQRDYKDETSEILKDWDSLMTGVFSKFVGADDAQIIVNLGLIHKDNEWQPYYDKWVEWMRKEGWRRFGLYVWDQGFGLMGDWSGRLAPSFEFIFHFNKISKQPNKIIEKNEDSIKVKHGEGLRKKDGTIGKLTNPNASLQTHKIPDAVVRIFRSTETIRQLHPAVFSLDFALFNVETWTKNNDIVYEPFSGSGTTIIACERLGRKCRAVEISPAYVAVAIERWATMTGGTPELIDSNTDG